jgi:hypothetical protein
MVVEAIYRLAFDHRADFGDDHVCCDDVIAAFGHNHVGVPFAGLNKLQVHRAHRLQILGHHRLACPAALCDVPLHATDEPDVGVGVNEE